MLCRKGPSERYAPLGAILPTATAARQSPSIFDPLDNRNLALPINYQKVSQLKQSQEVGLEGGLGKSVSLYISM